MGQFAEQACQLQDAHHVIEHRYAAQVRPQQLKFLELPDQ